MLASSDEPTYEDLKKKLQGTKPGWEGTDSLANGIKGVEAAFKRPCYGDKN